MRLLAAGALVGAAALAVWWFARAAAPGPVFDRVVLGPGVPPELGQELELGWRVTVVSEPAADAAVISGAVEGQGDRLRLRLRVNDGRDRAVEAPSMAALVERAAETIVRDLGPEGALDVAPARRAEAGTDSPLAWRYWRRARRAREQGDDTRARALAEDAVALEPGFVMAHLELAATYQRGQPEGMLAIARAAAGAREVADPHREEIRAWNAYFRGVGPRPAP